MSNVFIRIQSAQKAKTYQRMRRTTLSLFIGGLFCSAAPTWAACIASAAPNANGGFDMTCKGVGITQDTNLLGNQSNNNVTLRGDDSSIDPAKATLYGGYIESNTIGTYGVNNNMVTLYDNSKVAGVSFGGEIYGGFIWANGNVRVSGNTVTLNDHSVAGSNAIGGYGYTSSGDTTVNGNTVTLNNNSVVKDIVSGGQAVGLGTLDASNNTVTLNDNSSVGYQVYGGWSFASDNDGIIRTVTVNNNIVNINDTATISGDLYGGYIHRYINFAGSFDVFSGNTLNFSAAPITLSGEMANFENYNFTVDPSLANTASALITADTITFGTNDTNMKGGDANTSKIQVVGIKAGDELFADDKFVLMQATGTMSGAAEGLTTKGVAQQGISLLYDVRTDVDTDGKQVTATVIGKEKPVDPVEPPVDPEKPVVPPVEPGKPAARVNPQLKSLSEGHLASAMMLTRGADTLAYNTVHTIQHQNPEKGLAPFITLSGGKTRYNSGSHIDAKDGRLTGGLSYQTDKLVSAVIIESGWGSYNTHNGFTTMKDVNGDGHNRYVGAAVLGHYDFESGVFAEASLRAGKNHNTFDTRDIVNLSTGERAHYNLDSNYLGAHIGTGYSKALDEKNTADVSAKYLWTQLKGKDVTVAGDKIHFDDISSHRIRLDAGLSHQYTEAVALRAGLGYEYEFDGKAKATAYGYDIAAPGVQGSTAILTLGSTVKPLAAQQLSVDLNLNGYTGKRDGVGGSIKFSYAF